jgi:hypothetical protein
MKYHGQRPAREQDTASTTGYEQQPNDNYKNFVFSVPSVVHMGRLK